jgi:hypothetical protein
MSTLSSACKSGDINILGKLISDGLNTQDALKQCINLAMDAPVKDLILYSQAINFFLEKGANITELNQDDIMFLLDEDIISSEFIPDIPITSKRRTTKYIRRRFSRIQ